MARRKELVGTQVVRDWGQANGWEVSDRGRLHSGLIKAFNKAHADKVYTPDIRSTSTRRVQPEEITPKETPAPAAAPPRKRTAAATEKAMAETVTVAPGSMVGSVAEIMEMLQAASKNSQGQPVLIAAYTIADLD